MVALLSRFSPFTQRSHSSQEEAFSSKMSDPQESPESSLLPQETPSKNQGLSFKTFTKKLSPNALVPYRMKHNPITDLASFVFEKIFPPSEKKLNRQISSLNKEVKTYEDQLTKLQSNEKRSITWIKRKERAKRTVLIAAITAGTVLTLLAVTGLVIASMNYFSASMGMVAAMQQLNSIGSVVPIPHLGVIAIVFPISQAGALLALQQAMQMHGIAMKAAAVAIVKYAAATVGFAGFTIGANLGLHALGLRYDSHKIYMKKMRSKELKIKYLKKMRWRKQETLEKTEIATKSKEHSLNHEKELKQKTA